MLYEVITAAFMNSRRSVVVSLVNPYSSFVFTVSTVCMSVIREVSGSARGVADRKYRVVPGLCLPLAFVVSVSGGVFTGPPLGGAGF